MEASSIKMTLTHKEAMSGDFLEVPLPEVHNCM